VSDKVVTKTKFFSVTRKGLTYLLVFISIIFNFDVFLICNIIIHKITYHIYSFYIIYS